MQSAVFKAAFTIDMEEKHKRTLTIDDFKADVVEGMLNFMSTGTVQDESLAMDLYSIGSRYELNSLMEVAEQAMLRNLDGSNAFEVLQLARLHKNDQLKEAAFKVIKDMFLPKTINDLLVDRTEELKQLVEAYRKLEEVYRKIQDI
jgi:hypothetical protein